MAAIKAIQEQERLKKEARRAAVALSDQLAAEAQAADERRKQKRAELHGNILEAIADGREDDAISLINDEETDADLLCTPDDTQGTVLHRAAARGLVDCCKTILEHDDFDDLAVILEAKNGAGCTPLHVAARMDNAEVVEHLLEFKSDAGALDGLGWMARDYAHQWGLHEPAVALQEATMAIELERAAEARRIAAEKEAARRAAIRPPDLNSRRALLEALAETRLEDAMTVLANEQWLYTNEKDSRGRTALHLAAAKDYTEICRALLERPDFRTSGAHDKDRSTALHGAVGNRCVAASLAIVESSNFHAIDALNLRDQTALHLAAQRGEIAVCKAILERTSPDALRIADRNDFCALDYAEDNELFEIAAAIRTALGQ